MRLDDHLPDRDYRFSMGFRKDSPPSFYRPRTPHREILDQRKRWLTSDPERYSALETEGIPLLDEVWDLARQWDSLPPDLPTIDPSNNSARDDCRSLGLGWEPDFLLLRPDAEGRFRLRGGCLCFPSHWDLGDKLGRTMAEIHAPVPGLNDRLEHQIDGFLSQLRPGISWERSNWGLCRTPELNLHPSRSLPRLDETASLEETWWRLEEQSLVALPESGGLLFGIRLEIRPLTEIRSDNSANRRLVRALKTMPEALAAYKGIARSRERLIALLEN